MSDETDAAEPQKTSAATAGSSGKHLSCVGDEVGTASAEGPAETTDDEPPDDLVKERSLPLILTPEQRARRKELRKVFTAVIAGAVMLVVFGGLKVALHSPRHAGIRPNGSESEIRGLPASAPSTAQAAGKEHSAAAERVAQAEPVVRTPLASNADPASKTSCSSSLSATLGRPRAGPRFDPPPRRASPAPDRPTS